MTTFTHLHNHTDFSMLDGLGKVDEYVARAKKLGMGALAITDHGSMSGSYEFYRECRKAEIEPIIGIEHYFVPDAQKVKDEKIGERFHVVMLAKNLAGYKALCELSSIAHRNYYYKPVLDRAACESLGDEAENIIVLSGCAASILSRKAVGAIPGSASTELQWWRETFPNFYIELQHHNTAIDQLLNKRLLMLARRYDLPWVITNDPHYVTKDQCQPHDALLAIQTASNIDDENRFAFDGEGYHLKSTKEMVRTFSRYGRDVYVPGIRCTDRIARQCRLRIPEFDKTTWHIPKFHKKPKNVDSFGYLRRLTYQGLKERDLLDSPEYVERAKHELRMIKQVGIADFLLITREIIQWARKNGIWVGPGRGSTAGSLVGYLVGIHKCVAEGTQIATEQGMVPIETVKAGDKAWTRSGLRRVVRAGQTDERSKTFIVESSKGHTLIATGNHPVWTTRGWVRVDRLRYGDKITTWPNESPTTESPSTDTQNHLADPTGCTSTTQNTEGFTSTNGRNSADRSLLSTTFITRTRTLWITASQTWNVFLSKSTALSMLLSGTAWKSTCARFGRWQRKLIELLNTERQQAGVSRKHGEKQSPSQRPVNAAGLSMRDGGQHAPIQTSFVLTRADQQVAVLAALMMNHESASGAEQHLQSTNTARQDAALDHVVCVSRGPRVKTFNLEVEGDHEYFANGILTHNCDSVRYNLLFERFLNPERPKQPDIDTDFSQLRRDEVISHVMQEYGTENVLPVAAFQTMKVRGAFRKLATAMGMNYADLTKFSNIMNEAWGKEEEDDDEEEDHIRVQDLPAELTQGYPELVEFLEALIGTKSAISRHAAGLIIFDPDDPIRQLVPEMWHPRSKKFAAQFNLATVESIGLMKQDILGLRNGDTIEETKKLIDLRYMDWMPPEELNEWRDPDEWIPDEMEGDSEVYKMLAEGRNTGVFQLEGSTMDVGITQIKPKRFEDIVSCTSLYRKGPIIAGAPKRFLENKKARKVKVAHPSMEPILESSWGEMIYDEQMFELLRQLAGFSWARVDDVKTAMKKKDPKLMAEVKPDAINGFRTVAKMTEHEANQVWSMIEAQSSYLFNRSHAVSYSLLTYQTARYKRFFPLEYLTACMRTVPPKDERSKAKRQTYLAEAVDLGFLILPPDINASEMKMTCGGSSEWNAEDREEDGWLRFGFHDIKGIGEAAAMKIVQAQIDNHVPFRNPKQVLRALCSEQQWGNYVKKGQEPALYALLTSAGCLESIGGPKADSNVLEELLGWQFEDVMAPLRQKYRKKVRLPGKRDSRCLIVGEIIDIAHKKTKNKSSYVTWKLRWSPSEIFSVNVWEDAVELHDLQKGTIVAVEGKYNAEFSNLSIGNIDQCRVLRYATKKKEAA